MPHGIHPGFRPLGCCAPVAVNSGLRPETRLCNNEFMSKLFKTKPDAERRSGRLVVRVTEEERNRIEQAASIRQLDVAEFMRRAALGRKADVRYETENGLQLINLVRAIRAIHKDMLEMKIKPPEDIWQPIVEQAVAAMLRISK